MYNDNLHRQNQSHHLLIRYHWFLYVKNNRNSKNRFEYPKILQENVNSLLIPELRNKITIPRMLLEQQKQKHTYIWIEQQKPIFLACPQPTLITLNAWHQMLQQSQNSCGYAKSDWSFLVSRLVWPGLSDTICIHTMFIWRLTGLDVIVNIYANRTQSYSLC